MTAPRKLAAAPPPPEDFTDLADFLVVEPKTLPIAGVRYDFPGDVSARAYLLMQRVVSSGVAAGQAKAQGRAFDATAIVLDDVAEVDLRAEVFGDCAQQMLDHGVTAAYQERALMTLAVWHVLGRDSALGIWRSGSGEAPAPSRAARRSGPKAAGTTTRTRASSSGTPSPRPGAAKKRTG